MSGPMKINRPYYPPIMPPAGKPVQGKTITPTKTFEQVLQESQVQSKPALQFSQHALNRIQGRGIQISSEQLQKLEEAVDKAAQKGSKDTLVIMKDTAFIVSTKNKTVITAIDDQSMKDHVFTQIDSTILI